MTPYPLTNMVLPAAAAAPQQWSAQHGQPTLNPAARQPKNSQLYLTNLPTQTTNTDLGQMFQVWLKIKEN